MTIGLNRISLIRTFAIMIFLFFVLAVAYAQDTKLTVISNTKGAPTEMKMAELRSVLKGEKQRWSDGTKVQIALMKTSTPVGQSTCLKIYNMSADRVKRFWLEMSFAGNANAPNFYNTSAELESFVSTNPGAIGITSTYAGDGIIKITVIDGKQSF